MIATPNPETGLLWFVTKSKSDAEALASVGLDALCYDDHERLGPNDRVVVFAPENQMFEFERWATRIADRVRDACVAEIPRGAQTCAEAIELGTDAHEFLNAAQAGLKSRSSGDRDSYALFPIEALPEPIGMLVASGAETIGCDPSLVALPVLSVLAAAIGNSARLEVKATWNAPPIVWTALIAESGTHKSPAFDLATAPMEEAQAQAFRTWREEHEAWRVAHAQWKRDMSDRYSAHDGDEMPEEPPEPQAARYIANDTTVEALVGLLSNNPRGILVANDELSGWVGSFDRYKGGNGDAAHWLSMHDGKRVIVDRKSNRTPVFVPNASVSVTGCIQPGVFAKSMGTEHAENGLLPRFLVAMPPTRPRRWSEGKVSDAIVTAYASVVQELLKFAPDRDADGHDVPRTLQMDERARAAWIEWFNFNGREMDLLTGTLRSAMSKLEGQVPRLALTLHLARAAASGTVMSPGPIDVSSVESAISIVEWFKHETRRVYITLHASDVQRDRRRLLNWIGSKGGKVTVRDLTKSLNRFKNRYEAAETALADLVDEGLGEWREIKHPQGGAATQKFCLAPLHNQG